ncbi:MAG: hypothetical protein NVS3B10_00500 [Polyangiales bacterium]
MKRPCCVCGTPDECRKHLPDGRSVDEWCEDHPAGATLEEVGAAFGFCRERARQVERDACLNFAAACLGTDLPEAASDPDAAHALVAVARERLRAIGRAAAARVRESKRKSRARERWRTSSCA